MLSRKNARKQLADVIKRLTPFQHERDDRVTILDEKKSQKKLEVTDVIADLNALNQRLLDDEKADAKKADDGAIIAEGSAAEKRIEAIRNKTKLIIENEALGLQSLGFSQELCNCVFDLQILLAKACPVGYIDPISLENLTIRTPNLIAFSSGHLVGKESVEGRYKNDAGFSHDSGEVRPKHIIGNNTITDREITSLRRQGIKIQAPARGELTVAAMMGGARDLSATARASDIGRLVGGAIGAIVNFLILMGIIFYHAWANSHDIFLKDVCSNIDTSGLMMGFGVLFSEKIIRRNNSNILGFFIGGYLAVSLPMHIITFSSPLVLSYLVKHTIISQVIASTVTTALNNLLLSYFFPGLILLGMIVYPGEIGKNSIQFSNFFLINVLKGLGVFLGGKIGWGVGKLCELCSRSSNQAAVIPLPQAPIVGVLLQPAPGHHSAPAPGTPASIYGGLNITPTIGLHGEGENEAGESKLVAVSSSASTVSAAPVLPHASVPLPSTVVAVYR